MQRACMPCQRTERSTEQKNGTGVCRLLRWVHKKICYWMSSWRAASKDRGKHGGTLSHLVSTQFAAVGWVIWPQQVQSSRLVNHRNCGDVVKHAICSHVDTLDRRSAARLASACSLRAVVGSLPGRDWDCHQCTLELDRIVGEVPLTTSRRSDDVHPVDGCIVADKGPSSRFQRLGVFMIGPAAIRQLDRPNSALHAILQEEQPSVQLVKRLVACFTKMEVNDGGGTGCLHSLSTGVRREHLVLESDFCRVDACCFHQHMSCHVMSCHVMSRHVTSRHVTSRHVTSRHVTSRHVTSRHVMSCHVMSCHVMSCHVMSCHVMSCHVMLPFQPRPSEVRQLNIKNT